MVTTLLGSARQVGCVRLAAPASGQIVAATHVQELLTVLRERPADVLVLDPSVGNVVPRIAASAPELFSIGFEFPYLPVVFDVSNPSKALSVIARFPSRERCEAIIAGIDDDPRSFGKAIESVVTTSLVAQLVQRLDLTGSNVPPALRRTIRQLFSNPRCVSTGEDVARFACMSRRTLDRWLSRLGLVPAAELLHVARTFVAMRLERDQLVVHNETYEACGLTRSWKIHSFVMRASVSAATRWTELNNTEVIEHIVSQVRRGHSSQRVNR